MTATAALSANLVDDVHQLFDFEFMVNALAAATIVAVLAATVGWYMVLRHQSFSGHTLSVMAFPGATGAMLAGLPAALGYYVACAGAAVAIASRRGRTTRIGAGDTALIGTVQVVGLAVGYLFLSLGHAVLGGPETLLFGTILGITHTQVLVLLAVAVVTLLLLALVGRPLLLATLDPDVAIARGVPVGLLDLVFLLILGVCVAATSQITGVLLVFALLVAPPATAHLITMRPGRSLVVAIALSLFVTWLGLAVAYFSIYPVGFYVTTFAAGMYVIVRVVRAHRRA